MDITQEQLNELIEELEIEVVIPERRYWLIRAGKEGAFFNEFLTRGFTGIGYGLNDPKNINFSSKEELKEKNNYIRKKSNQVMLLERYIISLMKLKKGT